MANRETIEASLPKKKSTEDITTKKGSAAGLGLDELRSKWVACA